MGRSFLGINTQFIKNGKLHVRTLGVVELSRSHTAEYLKNIIMQTCNTYEIGTKQIYTVKVDNTANMLKTIKILSEEDDDNDNNDNEDNEIINITESEIADVLINYNNTCNETINNEFLATSHFTVKAIRWAAHILQLAVADLLKKEEVYAIIEKARKIRKLSTFINVHSVGSTHKMCNNRLHNKVALHIWYAGKIIKIKRILRKYRWWKRQTIKITINKNYWNNKCIKTQIAMKRL